MSIADKISRLNTAKGNIATAITAKGGTVSEGDGFESFASDIATIPSGITPTGTINITTNGTHDVTNYASANVNVSRGSGWQRPVEWGEYPLEFQQEKAKPNAERTMEAIYLLYHHDEEKYGDIASFASFKCTITGGYKVERGHMVGSTFTVDATTSIASNAYYTEDFTVDIPEYIVYRITPTVSGNVFTDASISDSVSTRNIAQIVLEIYGRVRLSATANLKTSKAMHYDIIGYGALASVMTNRYRAMRCARCMEFDGWDLSQVTDMQMLFQYCYALESLNLSIWNTASVRNMSYLFNYCYGLSSIDIKNWNTSNVTTMNSMFNECGSLTSLDLGGWNTSLLTNVGYMFNSASALSKIDLSSWDVTSVTYVASMFLNCGVSTLDCTGWDLSSVTNTSNMFTGATSLINFISPKFYVSVSFSACTKLSHDSLMSIINNLATVSTTQTLTLGATNRAKLTTEEIAIATEKGWTVA